jgi:hypothetical protein
LAIAALAPVARADDTAACLDAYEQSQQLRKGGRYGAAREQLVRCVRPVCPNLVKRDCARWMSELDNATPTVIVSAHDAQGKDLLAVRVVVDGKVLLEKLDGKPHPLDPGAHRFRYEYAGADPVEETVVVQEGEKNRVVGAKFGVRPPERESPPPPPPPAPPPPPPAPPIAGWVLLGTGIAGGAAFGILAGSGQQDLNQMRKTPGGCAPNCDESRVDAARTKITVANISLGVGVVAAGIGMYLLLRPRSDATKMASPDLTLHF